MPDQTDNSNRLAPGLEPVELPDPALAAAIVPLQPRLSKMEVRSCYSCDSSAKEGSDRVCRKRPPRVFGFMVPQIVPGPSGPRQGMGFQSVTQFPIMQDDQWCDDFSPRRRV